MPKAALPKASVIVCTYNRLELLKECLAALRKQRFTGFEIVVINDSSPDDTEAYLATQKDLVVVNNQVNLGVAGARNTGMRVARGDFLVFVDDECTMDEGWLATLLTGYDSAGVVGVGGQVIVAPKNYVSFSRGSINSYGEVNPFGPGSAAETWFPYFTGCNMSFRRQALEAVGGFDPYYRYAYEESDVCVRLQQAGQKLSFVDQARVFHRITANPYHSDKPRFLANYKRNFSLRNFHSQLSMAGLLGHEAAGVARNLARVCLGLLGLRRFVGVREILLSFQGAVEGYAAGMVWLCSRGLALKLL